MYLEYATIQCSMHWEMIDLKGFDNMIAIIDYDCDYLLKPIVNIAL